MSEGLVQLVRALEQAAARHGHDIAVNRDARPGEIGVTLGNTRDGRIAMIRQPAPGEGGRTTINYPNPALTQGHLSAGTMAWVELWAIQSLGAIRDHAQRMKALGRKPDAFDAREMMANRLATRLIAAGGHDLGDILTASVWARSSDGHTVTIHHPILVEDTVFHRYLSTIRIMNAAIEVGKWMVLVNDDGPLTQIEIHAGRAPPETSLAAAAGRCLSDLVQLPNDAGAGCIVENARTAGDGVIMITARCPLETLRNGDGQ
jgi:hypothetical protein